jgi:hypothetical protein
VTSLSGTAGSSGTVFVSSWPIRSILPLGMSKGSSALLLAVSTELMFPMIYKLPFLCSLLPLASMYCDYSVEGW